MPKYGTGIVILCMISVVAWKAWGKFRDMSFLTTVQLDRQIWKRQFISIIWPYFWILGNSWSFSMKVMGEKELHKRGCFFVTPRVTLSFWVLGTSKNIWIKKWLTHTQTTEDNLPCLIIAGYARTVTSIWTAERGKYNSRHTNLSNISNCVLLYELEYSAFVDSLWEFSFTKHITTSSIKMAAVHIIIFYLIVRTIHSISEISVRIV